MVLVPVRGCLLPSVVMAFMMLSRVPVQGSMVPGSHIEAFHNLLRIKRQVTYKVGFTAAEKQMMLDKHNAFRRIPHAANMCMMTWDIELETLAQDWARRCDSSHNPKPTIQSTGLLAGENIHVNPNFYSVLGTVRTWYFEGGNYVYSSNKCNNGTSCDQYTQLVWATSNKLGCGIVFCPAATGTDFNYIHLTVCNYSPAGNVAGGRPYIIGEACSSCPSSRPSCVKGLCSDSTNATTPNTTPGSTDASTSITFATGGTTDVNNTANITDATGGSTDVISTTDITVTTGGETNITVNGTFLFNGTAVNGTATTVQAKTILVFVISSSVVFKTL